jgi:hypothetical protein
MTASSFAFEMSTSFVNSRLGVYLQDTHPAQRFSLETKSYPFFKYFIIMALDPFTALGLAGNIVQFVDFGSRLFHVTREISGSVSGNTSDNEELSHIANHLQGLCDHLVAPPLRIGPQTGHPYPADTALLGLARNCKATGDELLKALRSLQVKLNGTNRKWNNVRAALLTIWRKGEIDAMCKRLESYKSSLALHLVQQLAR